MTEEARIHGSHGSFVKNLSIFEGKTYVPPLSNQWVVKDAIDTSERVG